MYIQSPPNRRQRPKRVNVKYAVQICLFLAFCLWLLYQIKHSHDKSKEFDETEATNPKYPNLGRKGIYNKTATKNGGDEIHEPIEEEEEDKLEVEEEDDADGMYMDLMREEEYANKAQRLGFEDVVIESDDKGLLDVSEHNGDGNNNRSKHGAREENYKADDASSAVTREAQMGNVSQHTENSKNKMLEEDNKEVRKDFEVEGGGEIAGLGLVSNSTDSTETKDADFFDSSTDSTVPLSSDSSLGSGNKTGSSSYVNGATFETLVAEIQAKETNSDDVSVAAE